MSRMVLFSIVIKALYLSFLPKPSRSPRYRASPVHLNFIIILNYFSVNLMWARSERSNFSMFYTIGTTKIYI